ncbi:MAG: hypothetical protein WCI04_06985 [archaeon]
MDFKLDFGPWESIFLGKVYNHDVEIAVNPDHFYIVIIYDRRDGKDAGAVIEGYKAYLAKGGMESFLQTMPRVCFGIEKNFGDKTSKLFFLSFDPIYVDFKQEDFVRKIDNIIRKTEESAVTILDLARASSVELIELSNSPKEEYAAVLGDPLSMMGMVVGRKENQLTKMDFSEQREEIEETLPILQLGLSKTREIIKEPAKNIYCAQIIGGGFAQLYAAYVVAENFLLENIPVLIIDDANYFMQLGVVSNNATGLREELVDFESMAFPTKPLKVKEGICVSIKDADLVLLLEMIGLKDSEFIKNLSLFCFTAQANTVKELIDKVLSTNDVSDYEKLRMQRMLEIVSQSFKGIFGEAIPAAELLKAIPGKLGRAVIIDTKDLLQEERTVFVDTLIRQLTKSAIDGKAKKSILIMPNLDLIVKQNPERVVNALLRLQNRGVGFVIGSIGELPNELSAAFLTKLSVVAGKDVAVSVKGKRNYRITLRPTLSGSPKN